MKGPLKIRSSAVIASLIAGLFLAGGVDAAAPDSFGERLLALPVVQAREDAVRSLTPLQTLPIPAAFDHLLALADVHSSKAAPAATSSLTGVPSGLRQIVSAAWEGRVVADRHVSSALSGLSKEDRDFLVSEGAGALRSIRGSQDPLSPEAKLVGRYSDIAARVDLAQLAAAQKALMAAGVQVGVMASQTQASNQQVVPGRCAEGDILFEDLACAIVVGGPGPNRYHDDHLVTIDFGGSDTYNNNAGGGAVSTAIAVDLGSSDDRYEASGTAVQGAGVLGAGLLIDEGGSDVYNVLFPQSGPRIAAQGSSEIGSGVLWDRGAGNDSYTSRNLAQGTAIVGLAALMDEGGADRYLIPHTLDSEGGQGAGCYGGFGALIDRGTDNDSYDSTVDDMQAFACAGSLGIISDGGGDDVYLIRSGEGLLGILEEVPVIESGWGQGYGELGGVAILMDHGGIDSYEAQVSSPPQGYEGYQSQGVSLYGAVGMLIDLGGDDSYSARIMSQGAATAGLGLLADRAGTDRYYSTYYCQGWGAGGVLLDGGGSDSYRCFSSASPSRGNGRAWSSNGGIGLDF